jgi:cardiolipin synthase
VLQKNYWEISVSGTEWKFTTRADDAWEEMLVDCNRAEHSIDIEQFVFQDDDIGKRFTRVLSQKARDGLKVRILLDGARSFPFSNSLRPAELKNAGVEVRFFNSINLWRMKHIKRWPSRDHRKLLVVDSTIAHTGGVGINARFRGWRDTNVRVEGPVVHEIARAFKRMWENTALHRFRRFPRFVADADGFQFMTNAPHIHQRFAYHALMNAIRRAKKTVYLTTPYFIPDLKLFRNIRRAASRGVDVRVLLPGQSDHPFLIDVASGSYFSLAMKKGVRFFKYRDGIIHSKTAIIDGVWSTVGSMNLDSQGLFWCYEGNIVSTNMEFARDLTRHFFVDLGGSSEIYHDDWEKRSRGQKILELCTWPIHKFL